MSEVMTVVYDFFKSISIISVIDILITAFIIYKIIGWIKGTQAEQVAKGILIILFATQISGMVGLVTINYVLKNLITVGMLAIVVMFQPELRHVLEKLGSTRFFKSKGLFATQDLDPEPVVNLLVDSVVYLSNKKIGALIIMERHTGLGHIVDTGTKLDSMVSKELFGNLFFPNSPLHDGAVIIDHETLRIKAAGCLLPLTQNKNLSKEIGTRHRAALGMSENSDCISVVVSEETGVISYAVEGRLSRFVDAKTLKSVLIDSITSEKTLMPVKPKFLFWRSRDGKNKQD